MRTRGAFVVLRAGGHAAVDLDRAVRVDHDHRPRPQAPGEQPLDEPLTDYTGTALVVHAASSSFRRVGLAGVAHRGRRAGTQAHGPRLLGVLHGARPGCRQMPGAARMPDDHHRGVVASPPPASGCASVAAEAWLSRTCRHSCWRSRMPASRYSSPHHRQVRRMRAICSCGSSPGSGASHARGCGYGAAVVAPGGRAGSGGPPRPPGPGPGASPPGTPGLSGDPGERWAGGAPVHSPGSGTGAPSSA